MALWYDDDYLRINAHSYNFEKLKTFQCHTLYT